MSSLLPPAPDALHRGGDTYARVLTGMASRTDRGFTFLQPDGSEHTFSFAAVVQECERRSRHLLSMGLRPGDHLALVVPEGDAFVLTFLACLYCGIVPVPLYPPLAFGRLDAYMEHTARILEAANARMLLTSRKVQTVLWSLVDRVSCLKQILVTEDLEGPASGPAPDPYAVKADQLAFLQFTSGSTSIPKGVMVPHRSILANARAIMVDTLSSHTEDKGVSWLPLYHDMGLIGFVLSPLRYAVPVYFIPTLTFVRRPTIWMEKIHQFRGTITFAPNFAFALATRRTSLEALSRLDLSCLKAVGCGAEPNHGDTLRSFLTHFEAAKLNPASILPCYGMAEATLAMSFCPLTAPLRSDWIEADAYHERGVALAVDLEAPERPGDDSRRVLEFVSCGMPIPQHQVRIVDEQLQPLPERVVGEILFTGPSVTDGYYQNPDGTAAAFTPQGLRTGDLGYLAGGELFITGRRKDLIILNGRNYDPQSIEWEAAGVEGLRKGNVVAFSAPGESTEQLILAAETRVEPEGHPALVEAVKKHVQATLFLPVADVVLLTVGSLPKTTSGKLQRAKTRQQYLEGTLASEGARTMGSQGETLTVARHVARSFVSRLKHEARSAASSLRDLLSTPKKD